MCLLPIGGMGPQMPPIPPNEKARKLGDYLRVVIVLHGALALTFFLANDWLQGLFDIIGVLIGYLSIRDPNGYNFQSVICYTMFCGMEFIWGVVRLILYLADALDKSPPTNWQLYAYVGSIVAGPIIYFLGSLLAYLLYKELRNMMLDPSMVGDDYGAAPAGGGGYAPQQNYANYSQSAQGSGGPPQQNLWRHPESHPEPVDQAGAGGFRAFGGQGHKLGGT